eukprot:TRINITY_DN552_c1_g1_i1.p1 TRINITY_DN552_c1_g1~~TRINITY_DN552_c1_g1_i1.p1  ORF type:complete len:546 (+),score=116.47 TRINITY_DN552_c1_g1_i1:337-1974(+)
MSEDEDAPVIENPVVKYLIEGLKEKLSALTEEEGCEFSTDDVDTLVGELTDELADIPEDEEQIPFDITGQEAFGDKLATVLLELLQDHKSHIVKLGLRQDGLTLASCESLANWIAESDSLLKLDLSDNSFGLEGLEVLMTGIRRNSSLQFLVLEGVEAGDEGTELIADWLSSANRIQSINLGANDIGEAGAEALLKAAKTNQSINEIKLKSNKGIPEPLAQKIQRRTTGNRVVKELVAQLVSSIPRISQEIKEREAEEALLAEIGAIQAQRRRGMKVRLKGPTQDLLEAAAEADKRFPRKLSKRFKIGWAEMQGRRADMQDTTVVWGNFRDREDEDLLCIFDGHGTENVAFYAADHFPELLQAKLNQNIAPEASLRQVYLDIDEKVSEWAIHQGTTAATALICGSTLYLANAGDTRAVLWRDGKAIRLTVDHKATLEEEVERVLALGGWIRDGRIRGVIQVSRAIGDAYVQPYVTAEPYTSVTELTPQDKFMIIACDGLWDVFTDEVACEMIANEADPIAAAAKLRDQAYRLGSTDNISVIVVHF